MRNITIKKQLIAVIVLLSILLVILGWVSLGNAGRTERSLQDIAENSAHPLSYLKAVDDIFAANLIDTSYKTRNAVLTWQQGMSAVHEAEVKARENWSRYLSTAKGEKQKALVAETTPFLESAYLAMDKLKSIMERQDKDALTAYITNELGPKFTPVVSKLSTLMEFQIQTVGKDVVQEQQRVTGARTAILALVSCGMLAALLLGFLLVRAMNARFAEIHTGFQRLAQGDFEIDSAMRGDDELFQLMDLAKGMLAKFRADLEAIKATSAKFERISIALDQASNNVMIADRERNVIYMNNAARTTLRNVAHAFRQRFPNFDADKLVGQNIDQFHKRPEHQRAMLEALKSPHTVTTEIGGRTFRIVASPVISSQGEHLGSVAEWSDLTDELAERERQQKLLEENRRIREGLDNVSTSVMIADNDNSIVYTNRALTEMFARAEDAFRGEIPGFNSQRLVGTKTDQFVKAKASHNSDDKPRQTVRAPLKIAGRNYVVSCNPVLTAGGERIGSVMEWQDRTVEIAAEKEVERVVHEAAVGNLADRVNSSNMPAGFLRDTAEGINKVLDAVVEPIQEVVKVLGALSRGDLTERITADYQGTFGQLRDDANRTVENLAKSVLAIREATDAINTASKEIAMGNADLSQRTEEQASSLEETASSMEELASTVKQNADNAKQANQMAVAASDVAVRGGDVVQQVVGTMTAINESSRKIVDIISVIDGIAFQTNILALNAAVEAARAGEQGRGFAVVAGEVRNLAQRSAAAAKEIKGLISDSVEKVEGGAKLVSEAGRTMDEIVASVKRVTDIMSEIAAASVEQSSGIEQVNQAVVNMDEGTQQNAALVEQAAAASESLEEQAGALADTVARFRLDQNAEATVTRRTVGLPAPHRLPPGKAKTKAQTKLPAAKPVAATAPLDDDWTEF